MCKIIGHQFHTLMMVDFMFAWEFMYYKWAVVLAIHPFRRLRYLFSIIPLRCSRNSRWNQWKVLGDIEFIEVLGCVYLSLECVCVYVCSVGLASHGMLVLVSSDYR